ncbi:hypothetical protein SEA_TROGGLEHUMPER_104 [Rhodococcus phage Trogglehumper]|uniref:Uncharacterized protein n=1 Tax=Rhodococcus phage Trogglehumper TaxID=3038381 RepID=A0AAF0K234_9CAUD|nr:hypothetical protein SEA_TROGGLEHUMPER_104 [Rhodococcus phage Trogglehumper]
MSRVKKITANRDAIAHIRRREEFQLGHRGRLRGTVLEYAHHTYDTDDDRADRAVRITDVNLWVNQGQRLGSGTPIHPPAEFGLLPNDQRLALALELAEHLSLYVVYSWQTPIAWSVRHRDAVGFVPGVRYSQVTHGHQILAREAWGLTRDPSTERTAASLWAGV